MLWEERRVARAYNRWMSRHDPVAQIMRGMMGPVGAVLVNTPILSLANDLALQPSDRVLDIGCGRAAVARLLARQVGFERPPVGLDASAVMLRLAKEREDRDAPLALVAAPATCLPFPDETFDVVLIAHMWKHLDDRALLFNLHETRRVLRPGGTCVGWEFAPRSSALLNRWNRWTLTRGVEDVRLRGFHVLASAATQVGFAFVRRLDLGPFIWPPIPRVSMQLYRDHPDAGPAQEPGA